MVNLRQNHNIVTCRGKTFGRSYKSNWYTHKYNDETRQISVSEVTFYMFTKSKELMTHK